MKLTKVDMAAERYYHKFRLAGGTVITEETTKTVFDNLSVKGNPQPTKTGGTWQMSYDTPAFDTLSKELGDNQYATQINGYHWVKLPGFKMEKIDPGYIISDDLSSAGEMLIKELAEVE